MTRLTVGDALQKATNFLHEKGRESSRLSAELLLAEVLGTSRLEVYLRFESPLMEPEIEQLRALLSRRAAGEPVAYLLRRKEFMGLTFEVQRGVLIPRPETEHLVEAVRRETGDKAFLFLDLGIGSGCIAVSLLHGCPNSEGLAVDCSPEALAIAARNADIHEVRQRLQLFEGSLFDAIPETYRGTLDWIVSNPPYIRENDLDTLAVEIRKFEPRIALDGGSDGLRVYRPLIAESIHWLKPGGGIALEISDELTDPVRRLLESAGYHRMETIEDYAGQRRVIWGRKAV